MSAPVQLATVHPPTASADTTPAEADLVRASLAGEYGAFDRLVHLHARRVFNYLQQMTHHAQDAEDLAQQTFIKAHANLQHVDPARPFIAWLLTIARRTALNHFRSARQWEPVSPELPATEPSPARQAESRDTSEDLWAHARRTLSPREYEVLWLRFAEELSVADAARVTGLTQTHIKILVFRARNKLLDTPPAP
ncbi:MAG: sigma-70 family RNA polymerase sigma factor [Opitutaceae bacterium]